MSILVVLQSQLDRLRPVSVRSLISKKPLHGGFFVWYNGDMIKTSKGLPAYAGFTVLEFLIVITIVGILIAIVLVSLSASRERARDDERIARVQNVSVALEQFYTDCRTYPLKLEVTYTCPTPGNQNITLGNYTSDLDSWNGSNPEYKYQPLSYGNNATPCTGYHIGVQFENTGNAFTVRDAQFNSSNASACTSDGIISVTSSPFSGLASGVYDLKR